MLKFLSHNANLRYFHGLKNKLGIWKDVIKTQTTDNSISEELIILGNYKSLKYKQSADER